MGRVRIGSRIAAALLAGSAFWAPAGAAITRSVIFLDGDASSRSLDSEDLLLTRAVGGQATTEFGSAVAFGDVNGDGFDDAIVGQRAHNRVFIYLGRAAPQASAYYADPNAADVVIEAPSGTSERIQQFGFSVASFDLDGDSRDDLLVGAPFSDPNGRTDAGLAFAILSQGGLAPGLGFTLGDTVSGVEVVSLTRGALAKAGDLFGFAVAAGRLTSSGGSWAAVTARDADATAPNRPDAGAAHVVPGASLAPAGGSLDLDTASAVTYYGDDPSDAFGESVAPCNLDGSGADALVVGAIFADGPANVGINRGAVHVFLADNIQSGLHSGSLPASAAAMTVHGSSNGDDLGYTVACGDLNLDSREDLVAGAIFADAMQEIRPTAGEVYVLAGRASAPDPNATGLQVLIDPRTSMPQAAVDLSTVSDPADPAPDGADLVLFGATTADQLGFALAVGDVDEDGSGDLIAGARRYDRDQIRVNVGATYVLAGSPALLDPPGPGVKRGIDLHLMTAREVDPGFTGPEDHLPDRTATIIVGASRDDHSSWALAAGDLNGDGGAEILIGAIGDLARAPGFPGEAYILGFGDRDADGATDLIDADNDNDGLSDQDETTGMHSMGAPTDPFDADSDGDDLQDGTELGLTCAGGGGVVQVACDDPNEPFTPVTGPGASLFLPDSDPSTTTSPLDADSDDDGLPDGRIGIQGEDLDGDGQEDPSETDASDPDSDGDLILDGTERGLTMPLADTNTAAGFFVPDADGGIAGSVTDPTDSDTDGDGLSDGAEDADRSGAVAGDLDLDHVVDGTELWTETDPAEDDTDEDNLRDGVETTTWMTSPLDQDSDDDGLADGQIGGVGEDLDGDGVLDAGESSPASHDTDSDTLPDGLERGLTGVAVFGPNGVADAGPGEDGTNPLSPHLRLDADGRASVTDPRLADTDADLIPDNLEDLDGNGAVAGDADLDHVVDGAEIWSETDPADLDTDGDNLSDGLEDRNRNGVRREAGESDPLDQDTDDDGIPDGLIDGANGAPTTGPHQPREGEDQDLDGVFGPADGESSPLLADSDLDGLPDSVEAGVATGGGVAGANMTPDAGPGEDGTDPTSASLDADGDSGATTTKPWDADTDDDGLPDGRIPGVNTNPGGTLPEHEGEDIDLDGVLDSGETNPAGVDSDLLGPDGVRDGVERGVMLAERVKGPDGLFDPASGGVQDGTGGALLLLDADDATLTDPLDGDSDEDGLSDGAEDVDGDGLKDPVEPDATDPDSDDDLLTDALERGDITAEPDTNQAAGFFTVDADPNSTTDPVLADTDGGGATDGAEDADRSGDVDTGERDPRFRGDDDRTGVLEFTDTLNGSPVTSFPSGTSLFIRLNDDADQNADPNQAETVTVSCSAVETVPATLTEVAASSGLFAGSLSTTTSPADPNDGMLSVTPSGSVSCAYADPDDPADTRMASLTSAATGPAPIPPLEVRMSGQGRLEWWPAGQPGASFSGLSFNVYRGLMSTLVRTGVYTQSALSCGAAGQIHEDATAPPGSEVYFYLVSGIAQGVEGPLGSDSSGHPRASTGLCGP